MRKVISLIISALLLLTLFGMLFLHADDPDSNPVTDPKGGDQQECLLPKLCFNYADESTGYSVMTEDPEVFEDFVPKNVSIEVVYYLYYDYTDIESEIDEYSEDELAELTMEEVEAYISDHDEILHTMHTEGNTDFLLKYGFEIRPHDDYNVLAGTAPFIYFWFDDYSSYRVYEERFLTAALDEQVITMSVSQVFEYEDDVTARTPSNSAPYMTLDEALQIAHADDQTYNGNGVKVGMIETKGVVGNTSHSELNGLTIHFNGTDYITASSSELHPLKVARVLCGSNGTARSVSALYSYQLDTSSYGNSLYAGLQWFTSNGCRVINISTHRSAKEGQYTIESALLDYYVRNENMTIVVSAGNKGENTTNHYVSDFAVAFNTISVGATDKNDNISTYSSYGASATNYRTRYVTVVAPGTKIKIGSELIGSGTSFSAPIVTGIVAKLIDKMPALNTRPHMLIAALTASSDKVTGQQNYWDVYAGAGRVNFENASDAITRCTSFTQTNDIIGVIKSFTPIYGQNQNIKISMFVLGNASIGVLNPSVFTDYDVILRDSSGAHLSQSTTITNYEFIYYNNGATTDIVVEIIKYGYMNTTQQDKGALSWYFE